MTSTDREQGLESALTLRETRFYRCANPFCNRAVIARAKHGRYCSPKCRLDGYILRRVKAIVDKVGVERFISLL